jgi:hypothetical protein
MAYIFSPQTPEGAFKFMQLGALVIKFQHARVAFRKSPSGDLGVKIENIKGILVIKKQNFTAF